MGKSRGALRPIGVGDTNLLMDLMAGATGPLHFLREFTKNGCEAIEKRGDAGTVLWDVDWQTLTSTAGSVRRLSVVDDGIGMTADELLELIGNLFRSAKANGVQANFGCGAKIAGARFSPAGVEYRSWHHGTGHMIYLHERDGEWGLKALRPQLSGAARYVSPLDDSDRPQLLRDPPRDGTAVTFIGDDDMACTYDAPRDVIARPMWIRRYLNDRFFDLPAHVSVLVREGVTPTDTQPDAPVREPQRALGTRALLEVNSCAAGLLQLRDATCHWWLLNERPRQTRRRLDAREWAAAGFSGVLYHGEIYDNPRATDGGYNRLSTLFRIRTGYERVVLLLDPAGTLTSDASRMTLQLDGDVIPWTRWGAEFARAMPDPIAQLQLSLLNGTDAESRRANVRQRWKKHASPIVARVSALVRLTRPVVPRDPQPPPRARPTAPLEDATAASPPALTELPVAATGPQLRYPTTLWLPADSAPTGLLEEQAARWGGTTDDVLTINPHFAPFRALLDELVDTFATVDAPDAEHVVAQMLREAWEASLVEALDVARRLTNDPDRLRKLTSPDALTMLMCNLSPTARELRRLIALRIGPMRRDAAQPATEAPVA